MSYNASNICLARRITDCLHIKRRPNLGGGASGKHSVLSLWDDLPNQGAQLNYVYAQWNSLQWMRQKATSKISQTHEFYVFEFQV